MGTTESLHELLPLYATGKLEPHDAEQFREHLDVCTACRDELTFLQSVQAGTEQYGDEFFLEHPTVNRLVDFALGQPGEQQSADILKHLELCDLCAAELSWVQGEEALDERGAMEPSSVVVVKPLRRWKWIAQWGGWAAAATAVVLLALVAWQRPEAPRGHPESRLLTQPERAGTHITRFTQGDRWPMPWFEIDLPGSAFPVTVEVSRQPDGVIFRDDAIERSDLIGELFYVYPCLGDCRPGTYEIRVTSSNAAEPTLEYEFEVGPESP